MTETWVYWYTETAGFQRIGLEDHVMAINGMLNSYKFEKHIYILMEHRIEVV